MVELSELVAYCDTLLNSRGFTDYCPNGLQVQGRAQIQTLVSGVTASQALLDAAVAANADAVLVHHGYFWRGEAAVVTGIKQRRIKTLLTNNLSLLAYHLPLDAHPEFGNNVALARHLDWQVAGVVDSGAAKDILFYGQSAQSGAAAEFVRTIGEKLKCQPLWIEAADRPIQRIAWCTGAAQNLIEAAVELGVDAYISGEISEQTTHIARESGLHYIAAGHHATERYGVASLGAHLAATFHLDHRFIDIDNPA